MRAEWCPCWDWAKLLPQVHWAKTVFAACGRCCSIESPPLELPCGVASPFAPVTLWASAKKQISSQLNCYCSSNSNKRKGSEKAVFSLNPNLPASCSTGSLFCTLPGLILHSPSPPSVDTCMYGFLQPNHLVQYSDYLRQPLLCHHFNAFMYISHRFFLQRRSPCPLFKPRSVDAIRLGIMHVQASCEPQADRKAKLAVVAKDLPLKTDSKKLLNSFNRKFCKSSTRMRATWSYHQPFIFVLCLMYLLSSMSPPAFWFHFFSLLHHPE